MALPKGFVYLDEAVAGVDWDAKYSYGDNLTGEPLDGYYVNRVVGSQELAEALRNAKEHFALLGYNLLLYDAYRPCRAVKSFMDWAKKPEDGKTRFHYPNADKSELFALGYIAERSGHSRGGSVDLTLTRGGEPIDMGGFFDLMDDSSHHGSVLVSEQARNNREILRSGMLKCGFNDYVNEWWHYTLKDEPYPDTYFDFPIE